MFCFRYLGYTSFHQVDILTIPEFELLKKSVELRMVDRQHELHEQAYLNFIVKAEKKVGKNKTRPVYRKFREFFDYEREIDKVLDKKPKQSRFAGIGKFLRKGGD